MQSLETVGRVRLVSVCIAICAMAAVGHTRAYICTESYVRDVRNGHNRWRWLEYAGSSTLMICAIAMLFGTSNSGTLALLAGLNVSMIWCGDRHEARSRKAGQGGRYVPFVAGVVFGVLSWTIVFYTVAQVSSVDVPVFVWAILFSYFVLFLGFPVVAVIGTPKVAGNGAPENGAASENRYHVLSLVSKTLLVWLLVSGVNAPS